MNRSQAQYDLTCQLRELVIIANKNGLYDAADFVRAHTDEHTKKRSTGVAKRQTRGT